MANSKLASALPENAVTEQEKISVLLYFQISSLAQVKEYFQEILTKENILIRSLVVSHTMLITCLFKRLFEDCHVALLMTSLVSKGILLMFPSFPQFLRGHPD